jgi:hypothetical protein
MAPLAVGDKFPEGVKFEYVQMLQHSDHEDEANMNIDGYQSPTLTLRTAVA